MASKRQKIVGFSFPHAIQTKFGNRELHIRDYISRLPDEILGYILSFLSLKDVIVTSVLSSQWAHVWIFSVMFARRFDFDMRTCTSRWKDSERYIQWMDKIMMLHKNSTLEVFRVSISLGRAHQKVIDKWLKFALTKKVESLEMCFTRDHLGRLAFPLGQARLNYDGFKSLKALSLNHIDVNDESLCYILSNCLLLERLLVIESRTLQNVEVIDPSPSLRHLGILCCHWVTCIKIWNSSLISLSCKETYFDLKNNPLLRKVDVHHTSYFSATYRLLSQLSQLQVLTLRLRTADHELLELPENIPQLTRLEQLLIEVDAKDEESLLGFAYLLGASPRLQKFVLKIYMSVTAESRGRRRIVKPKTSHHNHLKVAVVEGYYGGTSDREVVMYLLHNAVALEELVISAGDSLYAKKLTPSGIDIAKKQFKGKVPSQLKVTFIS